MAGLSIGWKKPLVIGLFCVVLAAGVWSARIATSGKPVRSGTVQIVGLADSVRVDYDEWGVPSIRGSNADDVATALGYVHANDRFAQMELGRRVAFGQLAELVGTAAIPLDIAMRRLQLGSTADDMLRATRVTTKTRLEAYADGVNAYLEERHGDLPPELRLLGVEPRPWRPVDSLAFAMLMARDLSFWNGRPEEARFGWVTELGLEQALDLLGDPTATFDPELETMVEHLAESGVRGDAVGSSTGPAPGSNNWAIAGGKTESGGALVANDPHLALRLPSIWYQAALFAPDYQAQGVTIAGAPVVIIGRGPRVAWAMTNVMLDDHDIFFERLDDEGLRYERDGAWKTLRTRREEIQVRGRESQWVEVSETDIGPLLPSDPERGLPPRSLAWTAHESLGDPLSMFTRLAMATDVSEVSEIVGDYSCPAQNLLVSDADGGVGWWLIGAIPERGRGAGRLPRAGWDSGNHWQGIRPRSTNPRLLPAGDSDVFVTANENVIPAEYKTAIPADYFAGHRGRRIRARLAERNDWAIETTAELQLDIVSRFAREVVAELGEVEGLDTGAHVVAVLTAWDYSMSRSGPAALFAFVERRLLETVFGDEVETAGVKGLASRDRLLRLLRGDMDEIWFDDTRTPSTEHRADTIEIALAAAWSDVAQRWDEDDPASWSYGDVHRLTLRNPLDSLPVIGQWMRRGPFQLPGSATTVAAFGGPWREDRLDITYGPSMRWIVDWGSHQTGRSILPGGQSGHPMDRHYDDQMADYLAGRLHELPWEPLLAPASQLSFVPR